MGCDKHDLKGTYKKKDTFSAREHIFGASEIMFPRMTHSSFLLTLSRFTSELGSLKSFALAFFFFFGY